MIPFFPVESSEAIVVNEVGGTVGDESRDDLPTKVGLELRNELDPLGDNSRGRVSHACKEFA